MFYTVTFSEVHCDSMCLTHNRCVKDMESSFGGVYKVFTKCNCVLIFLGRNDHISVCIEYTGYMILYVNKYTINMTLINYKLLVK